MRGIREANNHTKHSGGWWKYAPTQEETIGA